MKKIILPLLILLFIPVVYAEELSELNNYEIKYKFYKENIYSKYYPKGEYLDGYREDENNIKYSEYSDWQDKCENGNNREIEYKKEYTYNEIKKVGGIILDNFSGERDQTGIVIYSGNKEIEYKDISTSWSTIKLQLDNYYDASDLLIYAYFKNKVDFNIVLYSDFNLEEPILSKRITQSNFYNIVVNSKFYILPNTYTQKTYDVEFENNFFRKKVGENTKCRYRDILTYRYKIEIEYYDDNYYEFIEGYKKDYDNFKIYYQKEDNYIEVIKTEKEYINVSEYKYFEVPRYEYIEVPKYIKIEKEINTISEPIPIIKKEYIKENTPPVYNHKKDYIFIIIILLLLIVIYRLIKKCRAN